MQYLNEDQKVRYLGNYYCFKDTLFKGEGEDTRSEDRLDLLAPKPNKAEMNLRSFCYMDAPENIIRKMKRSFQTLCISLKDGTYKLDDYIGFGPSVGHIAGDETRSPDKYNDKIIAVCRCL